MFILLALALAYYSLLNLALTREDLTNPLIAIIAPTFSIVAFIWGTVRLAQGMSRSRSQEGP